MFDYYGIPCDTPGYDCAEKELYSRIESIENSVDSDIDLNNCRFNLIVHEFEALLFSEPSVYAGHSKHVVEQVNSICMQYENPEFIDNSPSTSPSKRLKNIIPEYSKVRYGKMLAEEIGIDRMLEKCPHFRKWVEMIISQG